MDRPGPLLSGVRVALFTGNYNYVREGANQALNRLVRHLEGRGGARVRVYSPVTSRPAFAPAGTLVAVPSVPLPVRSEFRLALGLTRAIRADLEAFAPEIVHLATPDWLGFRALAWARRQRIPVVASLHTRFESYPEHYRLGFARPAVERLLDRFYGRCGFILAPTAALASEMAAKHGAERVRVWSRGVDADLFHPVRRSAALRAQWGLGEGDIALLFFGRLVLEKGVDTFAEVARALAAEEAKIRPVVVGDGPARERLAKALPDAVFTGHLADAALAAAVASGDVLVNPSLTETFGNVVLEAMASGLAIVAADLPNFRAMIEHDRTGLLAAAEGREGYVRAVRRLIADRPLWTALGQAARAEALGWQWERILEPVLAVYAEALGRPV